MSKESVATLLNVDVNDSKLQVIYDQTESRLKNLLKAETIPTNLDYILDEVTIVRYNRLGSEGMTQKNVEGLSKHFASDDFRPYAKEIADFIGDPTVRRGRLKFL